MIISKKKEFLFSEDKKNVSWSNISYHICEVLFENLKKNLFMDMDKKKVGEREREHVRFKAYLFCK